MDINLGLGFFKQFKTSLILQFLNSHILNHRNIAASLVEKGSHTGQAFRQLTEGFLFVDQGVSVFATKIITPQLEYVVLDETT